MLQGPEMLPVIVGLQYECHKRVMGCNLQCCVGFACLLPLHRLTNLPMQSKAAALRLTYCVQHRG